MKHKRQWQIFLVVGLIDAAIIAFLIMIDVPAVIAVLLTLYVSAEITAYLAMGFDSDEPLYLQSLRVPESKKKPPAPPGNKETKE